MERGYELIEDAEALVVLGSSLQVMSGLRFVRRARANGIPVVIVNRGATSGDDLADVRSTPVVPKRFPPGPRWRRQGVRSCS